MLWRCMRNRLRGWRLRSELATVKTSQFFAEKQLAATAPAPHLADKDVSANALAVHAEQTARLAAQIGTGDGEDIAVLRRETTGRDGSSAAFSGQRRFRKCSGGACGTDCAVGGSDRNWRR